jgi:two-component sensor histidine kinase
LSPSPSCRSFWCWRLTISVAWQSAFKTKSSFVNLLCGNWLTGSRTRSRPYRPIISIQLRDQPQVRNDILDRLAALTATDHLIEEASGRGAFVHAIAKTELGPYVASRVVIQGPNVLLPPKYALTVALLVHELATNSSKYGSLSVPNGIVSLNSRITEALLELEWQEREGPPVSAPQKQGFGLRLLSRALAQLGGGTEILFESSGVVCNMKVTLPVGTTPGPADDNGQPLTATAT